MAALQKNQIHTVTIDGYSSEGLGVCRIEGQVVFVHGALRGEVCAVQILKVLKHAGTRASFPWTGPARSVSTVPAATR